jgi:hypothetical protein
MINRFRELLPYSEVPIRLVIRPRSADHAKGELRQMGTREFADEGVDKGPVSRPRRSARPTKKPGSRPTKNPGSRAKGRARRK